MSVRNRPPVIVALGGINMDLVVSAERMPLPGETVFGDSFHTAPGGKGANQAVAAARLGAEVRMVGRVGRDDFGDALIDGLRHERIDVSRIATDSDHASGVAMILLDSEKQNYIVAAYGANMACDSEQVDAVRDALDGADALLLQLETPLDIAISAARSARERDICVVWDPAPAVALGRDALALCDVITPNQSEAETLTGVAVTDIYSARKAAQALVSAGAAAAVVTLADDGAYFATRGGEHGGSAPFAVEVVDSVAAGDAFAAAMAVALAEGCSLPEAIRFGSAAGALAVTRSGAQQAMPYRAEVERLVAARDMAS